MSCQQVSTKSLESYPVKIESSDIRGKTPIEIKTDFETNAQNLQTEEAKFKQNRCVLTRTATQLQTCTAASIAINLQLTYPSIFAPNVTRIYDEE